MSTNARTALSRRGLVRLAAAAALAAAGAGCGVGTASPGASQPESQPATPSAGQQAAEAAQPGQFRVLATLNGPASGDAFKGPNGVAVDGEENLYVAELGFRAGRMPRKMMAAVPEHAPYAVSYTHLTLPTILRV